MVKFLYILVSKESDIYYEQTLVSILSLRHYNPDAFVTLLVDDKTDANLMGFRAEIKTLVNEYKVVSFDDKISGLARSRLLKTNMRNLLEGDFLYIDGDTAIADKLDRKLVIDDMDFDTIITAVQTGKADMGMAGMTVTEERLQNINFSTSYAKGVQVVIVPEGSKITTVDDLSADGAKYLIGTQKGTTGDIYAEGDFGSDRVMKYASGNEAVQALITGKVDCVIIDKEPAKAYVAANNK